MSFMAVAAVAAVAGAGLAGYSASQQADAQKKALNYQAQVDANNAKIAAWQRSDALQRGEIEAQQAMQKQALALGEQRAALAANGMDVTDGGSALDLLASTKFLGEQDVNTIQSNAARQAWGYDIQGMNAQASSTLDKWKADNINPTGAGMMAGFSSILSSAVSLAGAKAAGGGGSSSSGSGSSGGGSSGGGK